MYRYPADSKTLQTQAWTTLHSKTVNDHRWMKKNIHKPSPTEGTRRKTQGS